MTRSFLSSRVAALAAAAACLTTAASVSQQSCEAEGGRCPSATDISDEVDQASLLMMKAQAHDHAAAAQAQAVAKAAARVNDTQKCNEGKLHGFCYRTCTDMGEMEPRLSPSNCGGVEDVNFIQQCNEDGTSSSGAGSAPGITGRPTGGCFGDESANQPSSTAPNMCTQDCKPGAPSAIAPGCQTKWCCADGETRPEALRLVNDELDCSCTLSKKPLKPWMPEPEGVLQTAAHNSCNTGCSEAKAWLMLDKVAYCCPGDKKPVVKRLPRLGDYKIDCSCPQ